MLAQFEGAPAGTLTEAAAVIQSRPWFALLDGGGDVVALVEVPPATTLKRAPAFSLTLWPAGGVLMTGAPVVMTGAEVMARLAAALSAVPAALLTKSE